ncbi:hypothetical protein D9981_05900 [Pseudoalteromonas phenolica O-BC30]|nr:hypothetical protein D9981_05900 [Pseudoalteromonas phenolica O-BC30]TMO57548.1 hypothetical protein CWC21_03180 [Pseudoalteromonas phenolica]
MCNLIDIQIKLLDCDEYLSKNASTSYSVIFEYSYCAKHRHDDQLKFHLPNYKSVSYEKMNKITILLVKLWLGIKLNNAIFCNNKTIFCAYFNLVAV